jgi:hypothetical protein
MSAVIDGPFFESSVFGLGRVRSDSLTSTLTDVLRV